MVILWLKRNLSLELRDPWDLFPRFLFPAMGVLRAFHRVLDVGSRLSQNGMSGWKYSEDSFFRSLKSSRIESAFANPKGRMYAAFHDSSVQFSAFFNIGTHKIVFDLMKDKLNWEYATSISRLKYLEPSVAEFAKKLCLEPSTLSFLDSDVILEPPLSLISDAVLPSFLESSFSEQVAFVHPPFLDTQGSGGSGGVNEGLGPDVSLSPLTQSGERNNLALGCLLAASGCLLGNSKKHVSCVEGADEAPTQPETSVNPILFLSNRQGERFDLVEEETRSISEAVISCFPLSECEA